MIQLPEKFLETIRTQLDDEFDAFLESYSRPVLGGIRINRLKITPEEYLALTGQSLESVPWNGDGFYCGEGTVYSKNPLYKSEAKRS